MSTQKVIYRHLRLEVDSKLTPHQIHRSLMDIDPSLKGTHPIKLGNELHFVHPNTEVGSAPGTSEDKQLSYFPGTAQDKKWAYFKHAVIQGEFGKDLDVIRELNHVLNEPDWERRIIPYILQRRVPKVSSDFFKASITPDTITGGVISTSKINVVRELFEGKQGVHSGTLTVRAHIKGELAEEGGYQELVDKDVTLVKRYPELTCAVVSHEDKKYVVREQDLYLNGMDKSSYEENYDERRLDYV